MSKNNNTEISEEIKKEAFEIIESGINSSITEKEAAENIKRQFDKKFGPIWHCIVGRDFCYSITNQTNNCIVTNYGNLQVLIYKCGNVVLENST